MISFYEEKYSTFLNSIKESILSEFDTIKESFKLFSLTNLSLSFEIYSKKVRFHFDRKSFVESIQKSGHLIDKNLRDIINLGFIEYNGNISLSINNRIILYEDFYRHEHVLLAFINKIFSIERMVFEDLVEKFPCIEENDEEFIPTQLALVSFESDIRSIYKNILNELFQDFKYMFEYYSEGFTVTAIYINKNTQETKIDSIQTITREISDLELPNLILNQSTYHSTDIIKEVINKNSIEFVYSNIKQENKEKISNIITKLYNFLENSRIELLPDVLN